jgi:TetR/AcrR family transcriptional regulator, cholesterol catabolism regulator
MPSFQKPPTVSDDYRAVDIYRRAAKIIFVKGFTATSMGDIADAVDLTKGGLYYYIKGKEALLFAIMNFAMDLLEAEALSSALEEKAPIRRLTALIARHLHLVLRDPSALTILVYEEDNLSTEHRAKLHVRKNAYLDQLIEMIHAVQEGDATTRIDDRIAAFGILEMIHSVVRWHGHERESAEPRSSALPSGRDVIEHLTRLALRAVNGDDSGVVDWLRSASFKATATPAPAVGLAAPSPR